MRIVRREVSRHSDLVQSLHFPSDTAGKQGKGVGNYGDEARSEILEGGFGVEQEKLESESES